MGQYCIRATVSGRVQGVGYRHAVRRQALESELTGYASNLANGDVEVVLCGNRERAERVADWLWQGPPPARVTQVELEEMAWCEYTAFTTD
ncbi:acylphosphatase [Modicisalibacter ilicicola DSM 19980]|uniref:acylphosphatase n=1 Tax=Modicisalibacter ilicicola DSM 19980 TaxID=1121942 RepID=A0A1M4XD63_9GAMM|nr:acylphosphatase [Halomonas ilicicola]SHE91350.1 acylphosphatase [Halomonas ilicicola DSM 19980]